LHSCITPERVALGHYISFAGMVTYKKSDLLRAVAATIAEDRILVETDSPWLAPSRSAGSATSPRASSTAACLAASRWQSVEGLAAQTTADARRLFRLT
jgi:TatD DNase family protein